MREGLSGAVRFSAQSHSRGCCAGRLDLPSAVLRRAEQKRDLALTAFISVGEDRDPRGRVAAAGPSTPRGEVSPPSLPSVTEKHPPRSVCTLQRRCPLATGVGNGPPRRFRANRGAGMAKSDLYSNSLLPLALVAGILSGSLWRSTPASDGSKSGDAVSGADRADAAFPAGAMGVRSAARDGCHCRRSWRQPGESRTGRDGLRGRHSPRKGRTGARRSGTGRDEDVAGRLRLEPRTQGDNLHRIDEDER